MPFKINSLIDLFKVAVIKEMQVFHLPFNIPITHLYILYTKLKVIPGMCNLLLVAKSGQHTSDRKNVWKASVSGDYNETSALHGATKLSIHTPGTCIFSFVIIVFNGWVSYMEQNTAVHQKTSCMVSWPLGTTQ